uniref:ELM2 domain-containing protein n=1 Tax=Macrostomum lignano TaxID=282301 RepID=A0A1I8IFR1_9PLAT
MKSSPAVTAQATPLRFDAVQRRWLPLIGGLPTAAVCRVQAVLAGQHQQYHQHQLRVQARKLQSNELVLDCPVDGADQRKTRPSLPDGIFWRAEPDLLCWRSESVEHGLRFGSAELANKFETTTRQFMADGRADATIAASTTALARFPFGSQHRLSEPQISGLPNDIANHELSMKRLPRAKNALKSAASRTAAVGCSPLNESGRKSNSKRPPLNQQVAAAAAPRPALKEEMASSKKHA